MASIIKDLSGAPQRAVGFVIDISEALLAEEHLKQMRLSLDEERDVLENLSRELANVSRVIERQT